uniref:Lon protease-like protein, peroxisomal n=1 Tax=Acrasis kona TaxID=1008807 RepID=A0AAW2Z6Q9_9EUKA
MLEGYNLKTTTKSPRVGDDSVVVVAKDVSKYKNYQHVMPDSFLTDIKNNHHLPKDFNSYLVDSKRVSVNDESEDDSEDEPEDDSEDEPEDEPKVLQRNKKARSSHEDEPQAKKVRSSIVFVDKDESEDEPKDESKAVSTKKKKKAKNSNEITENIDDEEENIDDEEENIDDEEENIDDKSDSADEEELLNRANELFSKMTEEQMKKIGFSLSEKSQLPPNPTQNRQDTYDTFVEKYDDMLNHLGHIRHKGNILEYMSFEVSDTVFGVPIEELYTGQSLFSQTLAKLSSELQLLFTIGNEEFDEYMNGWNETNLKKQLMASNKLSMSTFISGTPTYWVYEKSFEAISTAILGQR